MLKVLGSEGNRGGLEAGSHEGGVLFTPDMDGS